MKDWKNCSNCIHSKVCKNKKDNEYCEDWYFRNDPNIYGDIYEMFEPIFQWIEKNYPNGCKFVVDKTSAKMYIEHGVSCYCRWLRDIGKMTDEKFRENDKSEI